VSIPLDLLRLTENRALGIVPYGGPGTRKTFTLHTCPPPIWLADFEGGTQSVAPWVRRRRKWGTSEWVEVDQATRQEIYDMANERAKEHVQKVTRINPAPYIDVVYYDNTDSRSYKAFLDDFMNLDHAKYNTVGVDSLKELTEDIRTMTKGPAVDADFNPKFWGTVQDRTGTIVRRVRNLRDAGVFVYLTASELIDKDYIKDPRNIKGGEEAEPISVKGNINMFGGAVAIVQHCVDILLHARVMGDRIVWVTEPEPIAPGSTVHRAHSRQIHPAKCPHYAGPDLRC
jgi:hypothetical protein